MCSVDTTALFYDSWESHSCNQSRIPVARKPAREIGRWKEWVLLHHIVSGVGKQNKTLMAWHCIFLCCSMVSPPNLAQPVGKAAPPTQDNLPLKRHIPVVIILCKPGYQISHCPSFSLKMTLIIKLLEPSEKEEVNESIHLSYIWDGGTNRRSNLPKVTQLLLQIFVSPSQFSKSWHFPHFYDCKWVTHSSFGPNFSGHFTYEVC